MLIGICGPLTAGEHQNTATSVAPVQRVTIPGTDYEVVLDLNDIRLRSSAHPELALLAAISIWISTSVDLPRIADPPFIEFRLPTGQRPEVVALYQDELRTIFLPEEWSGRAPAELSVLVHEMVHHIQNLAGLKYACPEAREKQAFDAQERFLALFGTDLNAEFEIDPFTLLVRTNCFY